MKTLFACLLMGLMSGCATIVHGTHQSVGITSVPPGARVYLDGVPVGQTPVIVPVKRGDDHVVRMELAGYQTCDATLTSSVSGWIWGNLAFGGLIGLAVDFGTGGARNISPEQVSGVLQADSVQKAVFNQQ